MYNTPGDFLLFYQKFLLQSWNNMGPQEYVIVLLGVGLVGWIMMRKAGSMG